MSLKKMAFLVQRIIYIIWILISVSYLDPVSGFYDDQPKIISNKGNLIIESARDKNITIRLVGNARLLANDVDLMNRPISRNPAQQPSNPDWYGTSNSLNSQERILLSDLQRNVLQLNNNTYTYPLRFTRINQRIVNINRRINLILTKLRTNKCDSVPCKNGGYCIPMYDNFKCHCTDKWQGETCEVDVDECAQLNGSDLGCQNGAWCQNTLGGYNCQCKTGFSGIHCTQRTVDCLKSPPGELCGHGICVPAKTDFGYQCICEQGWTTNGITPACTTDVDECESNKNRCHSTCINLPGSFHCGPCHQGYTGNGLVCRDINECDNNNGGCSTSPQVNCINTEGSYHCGQCPPGWSGDGRYCSRSDSISCPINNPCFDRTRCQYISGEMVCTCPPGLQGNGYGANGCRNLVGNPCDNKNPCINGGTCIPNGNSYRCLCLDGFDNNDNCNPLNPCRSNPCHNGGTCQQKGTSFTCNCPEGMSGRTCMQAQSCHGTFTEETGSLENLNYGPNRRCAWLIKTKLNKILNITFTQFDLKDSTDCTADWLQIHDGRSTVSPLIGRFCGSKLPKDGIIYSSHNQVYLWFRSDNSNKTNQGFHLDWTSIAPICGGVFNIKEENQNGVIKSPGYPGKSPPNRDCSWTFIGPYGKQFEFRFFEVNLGSTAQECDDYIKIIDSGEVLEKICESGLPQPKKSISNMVSIDFHTDNISFDSAFQLHYEIVDGMEGCGGHFISTDGLISSPAEDGKIIQNMVCLYLIEQQVGTRVKLEFTKFELASFSNCGFQSVEIYDGKTDTDPLIDRFCGEVAPESITSTSNFLLVKYKFVDNLGHSLYKGFEARYSLNCDQKLYNDTGFITSPGYPTPYYPNLVCTYTINAPMHNLVTLRFDVVNLSTETECNVAYDNIEVYRKPHIPERYCRMPPAVIVSETSQLKIVFNSFGNEESGHGFQAFYRFDQMICGGVLDQPNGTLTLNDISFISAARFCQWILIAPQQNSSISVRFDYFDLGNNNCKNNLQLFMNTTKTDYKLGELACGTKAPLSVLYNTKILTLALNIGTYLQNNQGFTLFYEFLEGSKNCGGNFSAGFGTLKSPNYPNEYPDDIECVWILHAPLGHQIELMPRTFSLENTTSKCSEDYLEIRNGMTENSPVIGKYCGDDIPQRIPSITNHLHITFHTDWSITHTGFTIDWEQTATGCGGTLTSYEGSIHSPHYPDIINGAAQCDWYITTSEGSKIQFQISNINDMELCLNGKLLVYDGPNAWSKKMKLNCSSSDMLSGESTTNRLFIRYFSYANDENIKFLLEYKTNCKLALHELHGVIESPNFPFKYPNDLECEWRISGRKNEKIKLVISHLELEGDNQQCPYDTLKITDMENNVEIGSETLCKDKPYLLTSRGSEYIVKFETDFSNGAKGFRLEYQIDGCGEYLTTNYGAITSPNYPYSLNVYCFWTIEAEYGNVIQLNISNFYIDSDNRDCKTNILTISNDKNTTHPIISTCDSETKLITSSGRFMYISFETDSFHSKKYFNASYVFKPSSCGGVIRADTATITSPNYPEDYPSNIICEWEIIGEHQHHYQLSFVTFDIETSVNCEADVVEIYDGNVKNANSLLLRHCGENLPVNNIFKSTSSKMVVVFKSNNGTVKPGWKLSLIKNCGTNLNSVPPGVFRKQITDNNCLWVLKSQNDAAHITVTFLHVECTCVGLDDATCLQQNGITIYDGDSIRSPEKISFCTHHPPPITSNGQSLTIVARDGFFDAYYSESSRSCGGTMKSLRGQFATPLFPNSYPANTECIWKIQAQTGNFIELKFDALDIVNSDECNDDYIEIRQDNSTGKMLSVLCGKTIPMAIRAYQTIWIKFRSTGESVASGFLASYSYVHDNELLTEITGDSGIIRAPPINSIRGESSPYTWRIMVGDDNVVMLNFKEYSQGLTLFDGFDENAALLEIQHSPSEKTSTSNVVFIVSDNKLLHDFSIQWLGISKEGVEKNNSISGCYEVISISPDAKTNLSSKDYPNGYSDNINCVYILKPVNPATHVYIELYAADLENFPECDADYITISTSNNLVNWKEEKKVCYLKFNNGKPHFTIEGTPYLKVQFRSDGSLNGAGFTSLAKAGCGSYFSDPTGLITVDMIDVIINTTTRDCMWKIELALGKQIEFQFQFDDRSYESDEHANDHCPETYALLRDGLDDDSPIIKPGRICRENQIEPNEPIVTSSNRGFVKFHFTQTSEIKWKIIYREHIICGSEIHLTPFMNSTNITTPNYPNIPNPHSECIWIFVAPPGQTIQIDFLNRFDYMMKSACINEYVELRDGSTNLARQIGKFCRKPAVQRTSGNTLYTKFVADVAEPVNGFKALVSISKCGGTSGSQFSGSISSENYPMPGGYRFNTVCSYIIKQASFYRLNLTIVDLNLPFFAQNLNESDRLEIYSISDSTSQEFDNLIAILYGNSTIRYLPIDSNEVLIKFKTFKANSVYRGFKILYERNMGRCFSNVESDHGILQTTRQTRNFNYVSCRWKITVPKGRTVSARIYDVEYGSENSLATNTHRVTFYNDFSMFSKIATVDNITEQLFNSTDNTMLIRVYGGFKTALKNLKVAFTSYERSLCPGDIVLDSGDLTLPTNLTSREFHCRSDISLNGEETLAFHIKSLQFTVIKLYRYPVMRLNVKRYWNFREFFDNMTNTDVAVCSKTTNLEIQQTENLKIFDFSISYKKHKCGGGVNTDTDFPIITIQNLTENYGRLDCAWEVEPQGKSSYNLTVKLDLGSTDCNKEYFAIYAGPYASDVMVQKLCGNLTSYNYIFTKRIIYLHYHVDSYSFKSNYHINTVQLNHCGGVIKAPHNTYNLEFKKTDYKNNLECIWDFQALGGFSTVIEFYDRFFIESSENCTKDSLRVKKQISKINNEWFAYPKMCGRLLPNIINTTSENVQLIFKSDDDKMGDGFSVKFTQYCGGVYNVTQKRQTIKSPDNWHKYRFSIKCQYTLNTSSENFINVKFKQFEINTENLNNDNCAFNKFKVILPNKEKEPTEIGTYCKKDAITEFRSRNFITFIFESRFESGNFEFDYFLESCGGEITSPISIHSPVGDDESEYPHGMECIWKINAPADKEIIVKFNYIDMEKGYECKYDYIGIYQGLEELNENRVALLCGNLTIKSPHIKISNNTATIVTRSDEYLSGRGFSAEIGFTQKCDKHIHYGTTNFTYTHYELDYYTPNGYNEYLDCHILFTVEEGYQIEIEFEDFNVMPCDDVKLNATPCACDYLEIFDSNTNTIHSKSVGKYCGNDLPGKFQTSQQSLLLRFVTDGRRNGRGFKAAVSHKVSICGTKVIKFEADKVKELHSPNFGITSYPPNAYCKWLISANDSFQVHFNSFQLQDISQDKNSCNDYVQFVYPDYIRKGNHVFCGNNTPNDITFLIKSYLQLRDGLSSVEIIFRSDSFIEKAGFSLEIKSATVCGSTFTQLSGSLTQVKLPVNCSFNFVVPEHYTLSFFLPTFFDSSSANDCKNNVKFYEKDTNELLHTLCSDRIYYTRQIFLKTNKVYVSSTSQIEAPLYLDLFYIANNNGVGCGGRTTELKGAFTSPFYPDSYRNYTSCRWDIDVSTNNIIVIRFSEFNMGNKINCQNDYLQLIDISITGDETVTRQYCGNDDPAYFTSKGSKVAVVYKRTVNFDGKGWSLTYSSREIEAEDGNIILNKK